VGGGLFLDIESQNAGTQWLEVDASRPPGHSRDHLFQRDRVLPGVRVLKLAIDNTGPVRPTGTWPADAEILTALIPPPPPLWW